MDPELIEAVTLVACSRWDKALSAWTKPSDAIAALPILTAFVGYELAIRTGAAAETQRFVALFPDLPVDGPDMANLTVRLKELTRRRAGASAASPTVDTSNDDLRRMGRAAAHQHDWLGAVKIWTVLLERLSSDLECFRRLATCYQALGDYGNAIIFARSAQDLKPDPKVAEVIDRAQRIDQRRFDQRSVQIERFSKTLAFRAFAGMPEGNPQLSVQILDELARLNSACGASLKLTGATRAGNEHSSTSSERAASGPRVDSRLVVREISPLSGSTPFRPPTPPPAAGTDGFLGFKSALRLNDIERARRIVLAEFATD